MSRFLRFASILPTLHILQGLKRWLIDGVVEPIVYVMAAYSLPAFFVQFGVPEEVLATEMAYLKNLARNEYILANTAPFDQLVTCGLIWCLASAYGALLPPLWLIYLLYPISVVSHPGFLEVQRWGPELRRKVIVKTVLLGMLTFYLHHSLLNYGLHGQILFDLTGNFAVNSGKVLNSRADVIYALTEKGSVELVKFDVGRGAINEWIGWLEEWVFYFGVFYGHHIKLAAGARFLTYVLGVIVEEVEKFFGF